MKTTLQILKVKDGVVFKHAHFQPHVAAITMAALETAPTMTDGIVWITEAYRKIRSTLDFHELCAGLDFRCKNIFVSDTQTAALLNREDIGRQWAERMSAKLGPDYDCVAHGQNENFHLHVEFDPR
jgi:hypothetical protein